MTLLQGRLVPYQALVTDIAGSVQRAGDLLVQIFDDCGLGGWLDVARNYTLESALKKLCQEMIRIADDPRNVNFVGPETLKLSNALADFRESSWAERLFGCCSNARGVRGWPRQYLGIGAAAPTTTKMQTLDGK